MAINRSNAANGTKQIWVKNALHWALTSKAEADERTIRATVERMLLDQLGYKNLEELNHARTAEEAKNPELSGSIDTSIQKVLSDG